MAAKRQQVQAANHPVFISHAAADKDLVNFFVDTVLISGIGIPHERIFNTSSDKSPIHIGENFNRKSSPRPVVTEHARCGGAAEGRAAQAAGVFADAAAFTAAA